MIYHSYLVRLWQSNEQSVWRASAQCVQTGNTILFGDIEQLMTFLKTEVAGIANGDKGEHSRF